MNGFLEVEALTENYRQCKLYTRRYAKTFYFSSHILPKEKRYASYSVYAFCRYADEIVDAAAAMGNAVNAKRRLEDLRNQLRYVYAGSSMMDRKLIAFRDTVLRFGIPQECFVDLLRGVEMDLTKHRYSDYSELSQYCYRVASVVGLMMARIFGTRSDDALRYAMDLGTAMQLTNILRDVGEDARRGRIYLPLEELHHFGYTQDDLHNGIVNDEFRTLMRFQIDRAREYYRRAEQGIAMLHGKSSRFCVRLMSKAYSRILDAIERNDYDVFAKRAYVPTIKKLFLVFSAVAEITIRQSQQRQRENIPAMLSAERL